MQTTPRHAAVTLALALAASAPHAQQAVVADPAVPDAAMPDSFAEAQAARRKSLAIIVGNSLGVALYGSRKWWDDGLRSTFRTTNEGWFAQDTFSGGADKLGHFYFNYASARLFVHAFRWAGNDERSSRALAALLTLGTFTAVEVVDGFSKRWRFSTQDALMNVAGVGAALLFENNPRLDELVDLRFMYSPSREAGEGADPFGDYSGQTYLVALKGSGVPSLKRHPVLRYLELSVGYGTRGYLAAPVSAQPTRNLYVGVSLNLSALLDRTAFREGRGGRAQRITSTALEFVQVPGTAALARHRLGTD
ncbi:MAG: DUF2279 domain-containing protein [Telluria sp.]